ncbi:long-subunit fatty acid transport protein [Parabacteroides sp. PFB2-10]|uniref:OmpP1/FadL family transporter n=1 Tax=Parabacteroides sp. PFB2-10 TaxID=1742405 RepID=UPI00247335CC|nr:outer membrane protein transport protein [Parabacteroides sp. PFB2-10]MDH6312947.1 long-subunit fatty acid transport protein [Parabacteroides sp. PFB2-10]
MKKISLLIAALTLCGSVAFSQSMLDAYKFGQTDMQGTARYMSMGGAFGALGGDISAMSSNPAGLAVYKSSEVVTTLNLSMTNAKTDWLGETDSKNRTKVNFNNIAYVAYFPTGRDEGLVSWNAGFSYNRLKNFNRHYYARSGKGLDTSLSDYIGERAYGLPFDAISGDYAYDDLNDWLSVLGFQGGLIIDTGKDGAGNQTYGSMFGEDNGNGWYPFGINQARYNVRESGSIDQYNISFGLNFAETFLFGATLNVTDINYQLKAFYDEYFTAAGNDFYLDNGLNTDGSGYGINLGAILRPWDFLRLGVAYNSPIWYKMTDVYYGEAGSALTNNDFPNGDVISDNSPKGAYTDYQLRTPDKWLFSAAFILGRYGLLSVDYEMTNYRNMKLYNSYGESADYRYENQDIRDNFKAGGTLRIGAEARITPQFYVRAGGTFTNSPMKDKLKDGDVEIFTVGTLPHYTIDKGRDSFSVGFGYRFTPQFYMDMACVATTYKEDAYAFSNIILYDERDNPTKLIKAQPLTLKTNRTQLSLTVGYKF